MKYQRDGSQQCNTRQFAHMAPASVNLPGPWLRAASGQPHPFMVLPGLPATGGSPCSPEPLPRLQAGTPRWPGASSGYSLPRRKDLGKLDGTLLYINQISKHDPHALLVEAIVSCMWAELIDLLRRKCFIPEALNIENLYIYKLYIYIC